MSSEIYEQNRKLALKETFDMISGGYDRRALRFFPESAKHAAGLLELRGDEHVLDVACGTGNASIAVARKVPFGRVTAVDFSRGMLDKARQKTASLNLHKVEFLERDMQDLGLPNALFDAAVCAFGIFFVQDMDTQLLHISSTVKPGGRILISNFQENYFSPLKELFLNRVAGYGIELPPPTWRKISNEADCRELFENAGLVDIRVHKKNLGYYLHGPEQWWDIIWNAGLRRMVSQIPSKDQEGFRAEHLEEVGALADSKGIWLDVGVLYTIGTKPEDS